MHCGANPEVGEVLSFWLGEVGPAGWYAPAEALDAEIARRFGALVTRAAGGTCDHWMSTPRGALALLIVLDQFPRSIHRGRAEAYRGDDRARAMAKLAIARGLDLKMPEPGRQFFYMPLMHAESLADQERCVRLVKLNLPETGTDSLEHAVEHRAVIRRFGRFPSRNAALNRRDTAAERAYRAGGGYMG